MTEKELTLTGLAVLHEYFTSKFLFSICIYADRTA
jgi:hypothetical protein